MFPVGMLGSYLTQGVYAVSGPFQPFGGAVDIIVVRQQDGSFKSSPWYVKFGDFQGAFKSRQKVVDISVNDVPAEFHMFLNYNGEAYFEKEEEVDERVSPSRTDAACSENESQVTKSETVSELDGISDDRQAVKVDERVLFSNDDNSIGDTSSEYASASDLESLEFNSSGLEIETVHRGDGNIEIDLIKTYDLNNEIQGESSCLNVNCRSNLNLAEMVVNDYKEDFMTVVSGDMFFDKRNDTVLIDLGTQTPELKFSYERTESQFNVDTNDHVSYGFDQLVLEGIETCSVDDNPPLVAVTTREINECFIKVQGNQDGNHLDNEFLIDAESIMQGQDLETQPCVTENPPTDALSNREEEDCETDVISKDKGTQSGNEDSNGLESGSSKDEESALMNNDLAVHREDGSNGLESGFAKDEESDLKSNDLAVHTVQEEGGQTEVISPVPSSKWSLWPLSSFRRSRSEKVASAGSNHSLLPSRSISTDISSAEMVVQKNGYYKWPQKAKVRTYVPTSLQLASLKLKDGPNKVTFIFTSILGKTEVHARIYLWNWSTRIVISDVDGTITKSDVLGQVMPLVGRDWTQYGVTRLFSAIKDNGFEVLFLSARAITQAYLTRKFLLNLKQDGEALPEGPVFISPDGLLPSLYREVIRRAPHEFKISCLEAIRELFPKDVNPFYAGFGNRVTDEISYLKVGIPRGKIFIINPKGEVVVNHRNDCKSYTSLHALVDDMFPPMSSHEQEDFNSWNFWKVPLPDIDDEISVKSSKSIKKTK